MMQDYWKGPFCHSQGCKNIGPLAPQESLITIANRCVRFSIISVKGITEDMSTYKQVYSITDY